MALVQRWSTQSPGGLPRLEHGRPSSCGAIRRSSPSVGTEITVPDLHRNIGLTRSSSSPSTLTANVRPTPSNTAVPIRLTRSSSSPSSLTVNVRSTPSINSVFRNSFAAGEKTLFEQTKFSASERHQSSLEELEAVVFLDVDGVLHPAQVHHVRQQFNRTCMMLFAEIIAKTNATIVLSTAWRADADARRMIAEKLQEYNLPLFVSKTPQIAMYRRTREILSWVKRYRPLTWVAIDDLPLMDESPEMHGHFVHTRARVGLQQDTAQQAIELFQAQKQQRIRLSGSVGDAGRRN